MKSASFSKKLLQWYDACGRKELPWRKHITPYRVWVSEIMLQQTQVNTVIPYFHRFMQHFPEIDTLAQAPLDEVLRYWSGLGYYARARNLHKTAKIIAQDYRGIFPTTVEGLTALPGIGRSTAGAILSISMQKRAPILDGNVKRILTRLHGISEWPGKPAIEAQLWQQADTYTPQTRVDDYTQAIMDLGATLCTRTQPQCSVCPFRTHCAAHQQGREAEYPVSKPRKPLPLRTQQHLLIRHAQEIFMVQRPPQGIWGGLWSLPECSPEKNATMACREMFGWTVAEIERWPLLRHTFTHFHLDIVPVVLHFLSGNKGKTPSGTWYSLQDAKKLGLPAPVKRLLYKLKGETHDTYDFLHQTQKRRTRARRTPLSRRARSKNL